jgi:hypothetical protein
MLAKRIAPEHGSITACPPHTLPPMSGRIAAMTLLVETGRQ